MARIIVSGYMIRHPMAGNLFAFFHYVLGLCRLGHEVVYLEESGWSGSCYDPATWNHGDDPHAGLSAVGELITKHGIKVPVCYVNRQTGQVVGAEWQEIKRMLGGADLLLNVGGICSLPEFGLCRRHALIDMDPLFTQVGRFAADVVNQCQVHFSYGANIGQPGCSIPSGGIHWVPTLPPVVPEIWQHRSGSPVEQLNRHERADRTLTTVANWSAYGAITHMGEQYGQKDEEFLRLLDLPRHTSQRLELALSGASPPVIAQLRAAGWAVRDAAEVSTDVTTYQQYIVGSRGEFSAAKNAYVKTQSGWFSDRSVCYLAAGLPVILQDTGFTEWLGTHSGVLAFSSIDEAVECIERVNDAYPDHCRAAREVATRFFDYRMVLPRLLETALSA
jgi:hypothetical protein